MNKIIVNKLDEPVIENREWNYIYNRYDLMYAENNYYWEIIINNTKYYVQGHLENKKMYLAIGMMDIPIEVINSLCDYVKKSINNVTRIKITYYPNKIDKNKFLLRCRLCYETNFWKLKLPSESESLLSKMSKKFNYNLKRERKLINEKLGEYHIKEYELDEIPSELIERFFKFKRYKQSDCYEGFTAQKYLKQFYITNAYALIINGTAEAMAFSCEQTDTVFLDNLAYNPEYSKYSLGKCLYSLFLDKLIYKNKKYLYLGKGNQIYKSWYGGIEQQTYSFDEYTSLFEFLKRIISIVAKKLS